MKSLKIVGVTVLVAAGLIGALTTYVAPEMIAWYFDPPTNIGVNCKSAVEWAIQRFQWAQLGGLVVGAVIGLFAGIPIASSLAEKNAKKQSGSTETPIGNA